MFSAPQRGKDVNPETCPGLKKMSLAAVRAERSSELWSGSAGVKPVAVTQGILRSELLQWRCFLQSSSPSRDLQAARVTTAACFFLSHLYRNTVDVFSSHFFWQASLSLLQAAGEEAVKRGKC